MIIDPFFWGGRAFYLIHKMHMITPAISPCVVTVPQEAKYRKVLRVAEQSTRAEVCHCCGLVFAVLVGLECTVLTCSEHTSVHCFQTSVSLLFKDHQF